MMQFKNSYRLSKDLDYICHNYGKDKECIEEAIVSKEGFSFYPSSLYLEPVEKLKHLNELWNQECFNEINLPKVIGHLNQENHYAFSFRNNIRILDMPIKFPHSNEFRCPKELAQFEDIIQQIASYEQTINPNIDNYYCYITIDQRIVNKGSHTRRGGLHVDGFQGERIKEALPIDHSYLIYDVAPTLFYEQPFKVLPYWNRSCHNYFEGFEDQKKAENVVIYPPLDILLINAYCLHEAPVVERDIYRTFFRMTYTVREFDRTGNAHNPMFDYEFDMQARNTQDHLVHPDKGTCGICFDDVTNLKPKERTRILIQT